MMITMTIMTTMMVIMTMMMTMISISVQTAGLHAPVGRCAFLASMRVCLHDWLFWCVLVLCVSVSLLTYFYYALAQSCRQAARG